jgi:hypothetical protein
VKRRDFLTRSALALVGITTRAQPASREPIIDIHQHLGYSGRPDGVLLAHQRAIGAMTTILLPAGRSANRPSTHGGLANGLQAEALGNDACHRFVQGHRRAFRFGANDVPDLENAAQEIERYLKRGAVVIAEQKFGVECDSAEMQTIDALAAAYDVPVLMHWQFKMYNYGFERVHAMLELLVASGFSPIEVISAAPTTAVAVRYRSDELGSRRSGFQGGPRRPARAAGPRYHRDSHVDRVMVAGRWIDTSTYREY